MAENSGQIKPGEIRNSNGRPKKERCLTALMEEYLESTDDSEKQRKCRLIEKIYELAMEGDTVCLKMILNYIDGMPKQSIAVEGSAEENPILIALQNMKGVIPEDTTTGDTDGVQS